MKNRMKFNRRVMTKVVSDRRPAGFIVGWALVTVWLGGMAWFNAQLTTPSSPDEATNKILASTLAEHGRLTIPTPLTPDQLAAFHPRSFSVVGANLASGSFLGFVQLQSVAIKFGGQQGPLVLTLLAFTGALVAFYRLGRRYWPPNWAMIGVGLVSTMPAIIIFNALTWHHAALFTSLLVITGFALLRFQERQTWGRAITVGLVYGLALMVRPIEVLFTGPAIAVVMIVHRHGWRYLLGTIGTVVLMQLPWLIAGGHVFGGFLASGYAPGGLTVAGESGASFSWWRIFVPAGGAWTWHWISAAWSSLVLLMPVISMMTLVALGTYFRRKMTSWKKALKLGTICLFATYYLAYYGSLDLAPITTANVGFQISYVRYWLPLFAAMAAGVVVFLRGVSHVRSPTALAIGVVIIALNITTTVWSNFGLVDTIKQQRAQKEIQARVLDSTEPESFLFAHNYDKVFIGQRLTSYRDPSTDQEWQLVKEILAVRPVYFLLTPVSRPEKEWQDALHQHGLKGAKYVSVADAALWRIEETQP